MSQCYNCGTEFTLSNEEVKCDSCHKQVNFPCHNCKQWFSISDNEGKKLKGCAYCGFFTCPNCNTCGPSCEKSDHIQKVIEIINSEKEIYEKAKDISDYFGDVKLGRDRRICPRNVSISYAKSRIKRCFVKLKGHRIKNDFDLEKFKERFDLITDKPLGTKFTINQTREEGSYGQEFRDVFNLCICLGKLKKIKIVKKIDAEDIEYEGYKRIEESTCPKFDAEKLITKECSNKKCKIKSYPESQNECLCPECRYVKGVKKGQLRKLNLKISNKDICQLNRGDFIKDGENRFR
ncbi:MAG: hypothetical protein ACTSQ4_02205 [Candidatus Heimdallarchaeaceae archaeon]